MGSKSSRGSGIGNFNSPDWEQLPPAENNPTFGDPVSYTHRITHEQIDKYQLHFASSKEENNYYECSLQRLREDYIVNTVHYINKSAKDFCSNTYCADVYIEHIPVRLSDITDIPYPENIYILRNCLLGFKQLYNIIGYFKPTEELVCIDKYGEVKVWMNPDLSKNYPNDSSQPNQEPESAMVKSIFILIEQNTDLNTCPEPISHFLIENGQQTISFVGALELIEDYIMTHRTNVPLYCESILQIFRDEEQEDSHDMSGVVLESEPELVIGNTVIPKLEIGKNTKGRPQMPTFQKEYHGSEGFPLNSTERTKEFKQDFTDKMESSNPISTRYYALSNTNRLIAKETPVRSRPESHRSKPISTRANITFTYTSRKSVESSNSPQTVVGLTQQKDSRDQSEQKETFAQNDELLKRMSRQGFPNRTNNVLEMGDSNMTNIKEMQEVKMRGNRIEGEGEGRFHYWKDCGELEELDPEIAADLNEFFE